MSDDQRELVGRLFELVDAPFHDALRALLDEVAALKAQRDEADAECREANASWCREAKECIDLNRELASMREQRDEARREVCQWVCCGFDGAKNAAKMRGWDCFEKEAKP
jgi:uncharacterized coiled-coil DUF342 family protein